jgi:ribose 5-phosphate isomerase A
LEEELFLLAAGRVETEVLRGAFVPEENRHPDQQNLKLKVAEHALELVKPGMTIGLGSGSTASLWIQLLGEQVRDYGMRIQAIASSEASENLGRSFGIPFVKLEDCEYLDLAVDGADEIAPGLALIKGGGGNLLREKIVATATKQFVVIADDSKVVDRLGRFPLPVEVIPMAVSLVRRSLERLGFKTALRMKKDGSSPYITDEGNLLFDCSGDLIEDPQQLAAKLDRIVGLVDHGLFLDMASLALIATDDGVLERSS